MKERNILFVDPNRIWADTLDAAKEEGHRISIIHSKRHGSAYGPMLACADQTVEADTRDVDSLTHALRTISERSPVSAVLTSNDDSILQTALACEANRINFTSPDGVRTARDKGLTRTMLRQHGMEVPRFELATVSDQLVNVMRTVGFPCAVKPVRGYGSNLAFRVESPRCAEKVAAEIFRRCDALTPSQIHIVDGGFICESWLEGPILSAEVAFVNGEFIRIAIALGTTQPENPCAGSGSIIPFVCEPAMSDACFEYAAHVCKLMGLSLGVFNVEMIWTTRGPVLLEVNPRRMGGEMGLAYELATGQSFSHLLLCVYCGDFPRQNASTSHRTAVIRKIMPARDGRLSDTLSRRWRQFNDAEVHLVNYSLAAGRNVRRLDVLARLIVVSDQPATGFAVAEEALRRLESEGGVDLVFGTLPVVAAEH